MARKKSRLSLPSKKRKQTKVAASVVIENNKQNHINHNDHYSDDYHNNNDEVDDYTIERNENGDKIDLEDIYEEDEEDDDVDDRENINNISNQSFYSRLLNKYRVTHQPILFDTIYNNNDSNNNNNKSQHQQRQNLREQQKTNEIIIQDIIHQFQRRRGDAIKKHNEGVGMPIRHNRHADGSDTDENDTNIDSDFESDYDSLTFDSDFDDISSSTTTSAMNSPIIPIASSTTSNNSIQLPPPLSLTLNDDNNQQLQQRLLHDKQKQRLVEIEIKRELKRKRKGPQSILKSTRMDYGVPTPSTLPSSSNDSFKSNLFSLQGKESPYILYPPSTFNQRLAPRVIQPISQTKKGSIIPNIVTNWNGINNKTDKDKEDDEDQKDIVETNNIITTNIKHDYEKYKERMIETRALHSSIRKIILDLASRNQLQLLQDPCLLWTSIANHPEFKVFNKGNTVINTIKTGLYLTELLMTILNQPDDMDDMEQKRQLEEEDIEMEEFLDKEAVEEGYGKKDMSQIEEEMEEDDPLERAGFGWDLQESKLVEEKDWNAELQESETILEKERHANLQAMKLDNDTKIPHIFNPTGLTHLFTTDSNMESIPNNQSLVMMIEDLRQYLKPIIRDLVSGPEPPSNSIPLQKVIWSLQVTNSLPHPNWLPSKQFYKFHKHQPNLVSQKSNTSEHIDFYKLANEKLLSPIHILNNNMYKKVDDEDKDGRRKKNKKHNDDQCIDRRSESSESESDDDSWSDRDSWTKSSSSSSPSSSEDEEETVNKPPPKPNRNYKFPVTTNPPPS